MNSDEISDIIYNNKVPTVNVDKNVTYILDLVQTLPQTLWTITDLNESTDSYSMDDDLSSYNWFISNDN